MNAQGGDSARPRSRIALAESDEQVRACFAVVQQLRTHLGEQEFVERVARQRLAGYELVSLRDDSDRVVAAAGYRVIENLVSRKVLHVDDLVTDASERSQGYGAELVAWLVEAARAKGCSTLELDSGVQRTDAHRFYLRHGFAMDARHFRLRID